jgi:hypothetical protein
VTLPDDPRDDERYVQAVADAGMALFLDDLAVRTVPCLRLKQDPHGAHLLGGAPTLADGWPKHGRAPLLFVAGIDLAAARDAAQDRMDTAFAGLPDDGWLAFFTQHLDDPQPDFTGTDPACWDVRAEPDLSADDLRAAGPLPQLPRARATARLAWSVDVLAVEALVPEIDTDPVRGAQLANRAIHAIQGLADGPLHQFGGHAASVAADPVRVVEARAVRNTDLVPAGYGQPDDDEPAWATDGWQLLLQLDEDVLDGHKMRWADSGRAYYLRPDGGPADQAVEIIQGF